MPYLLFLVIMPTSILKLSKTKIKVTCTTLAFSYALWNMHMFLQSMLIPQLCSVKEGTEELSTTDTSAEGTESILSVW